MAVFNSDLTQIIYEVYQKVIDVEVEAGEYDVDDVEELEGTCLAKIFFGIFGLLPLVWS